jgi:hypothetical protein
MAMLDGLKLALLTMQDWDEMAQVRKDIIMDSLQELVTGTEKFMEGMNRFRSTDS